jgi:hypothetical protein
VRISAVRLALRLAHALPRLGLAVRLFASVPRHGFELDVVEHPWPPDLTCR